MDPTRHFTKAAAFFLAWIVSLPMSQLTYGQDGVLIDYVGATRDASAVLDVRSSSQGALVPRLTYAQRNAIASPATSLLIFQTDNFAGNPPGYYYNSGTPGLPVWTRFFEGTSNNNTTGAGTQNYVVKWNNSGGSTIGNSQLFDNGTNVGVGTALPSQKLDVNGGLRTASGSLTLLNDYIYVSPSNANTMNAAYATNGLADMWLNYRGYNDGFTQVRNMNVGDGRGANIAWFDGSNRRMSINNGQAASYTLDVNGDINLAGNADLRMSGIPVLSGTSTDVYGNIRVLQNMSAATQDGMYINYNSTGGTAADIRFYANGATERMRIQASGGNVGIGLIPGAYNLDVNGSMRISANNVTGGGIFLADDGSIVDNNDGYATHRFSSGLAVTNGNNANTQRILLRSDGNIQMLNNVSPTINFNDSDEPDYYLHTNGNRLYVLHGDGYNAWNGNRPLTVFQGDKVGINEISPSWRLQVNGANTPSFLAQQNGTHSYGIVAGLETFNNGAGTQDGPRLGFHKHGAKTWSIGIEPYGNNGFAIWEDGYDGGWGSNAKFIIPPGGGLSKVLITAGGSVYQDWPGGWGGGLASWDMCVASIRLSGTSNRSDVRLKKDIENVGDNAISTVMALRPVSYHWIDEKLPQRKIYGFVAQEVQTILPEIIEEGTDEMKTLGMSYTDLIPILTKALQEQQFQLEQQKEEIQELRALVDRLTKLRD